ncbi:MAG: hypothetical protein ACREFA_11580, partial [Stellaceae bacterium]
KSLGEIRGILRDLDERGWEKALPKGGPGAFLQRAASASAPRPTPAEAVCVPVLVMPRRPASGASVMLDRLPIAAPRAVSLPRRNSRTLAVLMATGLLVLSASSLVVARGSGLSRYAAGLFGNDGQARTDAGPVVAAHAALPPALIPAVAKNHAAAAPLPTAAARPKPLPIAFEGPVQRLGARAVSVAAPPAKTVPPQTKAASPARAAPARPAPAVPAQRALDPSVGRSLRQAGDMKILEGDVASARLFYERAADAGDARAALDLGNSFNPAFLGRIGVLGMRGDTVAAAHWYRRARALGSSDAGKALHALPR